MNRQALGSADHSGADRTSDRAGAVQGERHAYSRGASYGIEKIAGEFAGRLAREGPRVSQSKGSLGYVKSRAALACHPPDED